MGLADGSEPYPPKFITTLETNEQVLNSAYVLWQKRDQHLHSWILCSLKPALISSMYELNTSHQAWGALAERFVSQSRSHISYLKRQLQTLQQGSKSCTEYIRQAKQWADQLAAAGKPVAEDDLISYLISGLNPIFNSFITAFSFANRNTEMTFADFQTELLSREMLLENQKQQLQSPEHATFAFYSNRANPSTFHPSNKKSRFRSKTPPRFSTPSPRYSLATPRFSAPLRRPPTPHTIPGRNISPSFPTRPPHNNHHNPLPTCQICGKHNHTALDCYHRMDYTYQGRYLPSQLTAMIAHNTDFDNHDWLADSGANTHVAADPTTINDP
jgi:hypothetical protein